MGTNDKVLIGVTVFIVLSLLVLILGYYSPENQKQVKIQNDYNKICYMSEYQLLKTDCNTLDYCLTNEKYAMYTTQINSLLDTYKIKCMVE